jgi:hypothetical protein
MAKSNSPRTARKPQPTPPTKARAAKADAEPEIVYPLFFLRALADAADEALYAWLKDSAPEEIFALYRAMGILKACEAHPNHCSPAGYARVFQEIAVGLKAAGVKEFADWYVTQPDDEEVEP